MASGRSIATRTVRSWPRVPMGVVVALLLAVHWLLAVASVSEKSTTFDEIGHLTAGVSLLKTGDYRLLPEHPPLSHVWAAAPVVVSGFTFPDLNRIDWWRSNHWGLGRRFFYECGNDPQAMLLRGRASIAILSVALGLVVWLWSRRLFGRLGGVLSLVLYAFSPTMLAHARLITTDMVAALFLLVATTAVWWLLRHVSARSIALTALALTGLLLSKMSALLILPIAGLLLLVRLISGRPTYVALRGIGEIRSRPRQFGVWALLTVVQVLLVTGLLWTAYAFRFSAMRDAAPGRDRLFTPVKLSDHVGPWDFELAGLGRMGWAIAWARDNALLPEAYLYGVAYALHHSQRRPAFLNGETRQGGWWYFFPYCFAVKTPLPLIGILLLGAAGLVWWQPAGAGDKTPDAPRRRVLLDGVYRTAPLWVLFAVYWASALSTGLNIGHRHLLPTYPVLLIFAGGAALWFRSSNQLMRGAAPALAVLFIGSSFLTFPNYLAYFNVLIGGPRNAYRHLVDSSLDWGQDLLGLKRWLDEHGDAIGRPRGEPGTSHVYLSYFGTGLPEAYDIEARMLPGYLSWQPVWTGPLGGGVYCISATMLHQLRLLPECRWTRALEAAYQDLRRRSARAAKQLRANPTAQLGADAVAEADVRLFHKLRFARLCAALRQRQPDYYVGYSILIYVLDDVEVAHALRGEPGELMEDGFESLLRLATQCFLDGCHASAVIFYEDLLGCQASPRLDVLTEVRANLAASCRALGREQEAVARLREGLRRAPRSARLNNDLAWMLATSRSADLRNGQEALRRAQLAVELTNAQNPAMLDTLAAAHAELGQFEEACQRARAALKIARARDLSQLAAEIVPRLERYEAGQPWRSPGAAPR